MARRVFFAFHYKDVAEFRANAVRNHNVVKQDDAEYFDASLWEDVKKTGDAALKRMINSAIDRTTVTAVLVGSETCVRRWVRYEIMRSLWKGNLLLGIHINSIPGKDQLTKAPGSNPFDYLGYRIGTDGRRIELFEWGLGKWISYSDLDGWVLGSPRETQFRGQSFQLSKHARMYDWMNDRGYNNFNSWIGA